MILLNGIPVTVLPKGQKRKHKKKRINKKWLKRYGLGSGSHIKDDEILVINDGYNKRLIMNFFDMAKYKAKIRRWPIHRILIEEVKWLWSMVNN